MPTLPTPLRNPLVIAVATLWLVACSAEHSALTGTAQHADPEIAPTSNPSRDKDTAKRTKPQSDRSVKQASTAVATESERRLDSDPKPPSRALAPRPGTTATPSQASEPGRQPLAPPAGALLSKQVNASAHPSGSGALVQRQERQITPPAYREPPSDRERYASFSDNPLRSVRQDPLSTFGVDVDTASYTLARQELRQGRLPRPESVRTEEWLNYFDYSYPQPSAGGHPFSVTTELAPAPWDADKQLLLVGLKGYDIDRAQLPPLNLTFLIDVSGSMSAPNKLPLAQNALAQLTRQLRPQDRVAIVVYAGAAGLVLESTPGDQQQTILDALNRLHAGGSTAGGAGIQLAYASARQHRRAGALSRVILLSDGDFNVGTSDTEALKRLVARERDQGIALSVLTFGRGNIRDELMNSLAETGNGNAGYIDSALEARRFLVEQMSGTLMTIAKDVKAQLEFNPQQVAEYRLLGYETRRLQAHEFNDDRKDAGEIGAGHRVTALYELTLTDSNAALTPPLRYLSAPAAADRAQQPTSAEGAVELAFLKLRYKQPAGHASILMTQPIYRQQLQPATASSSDNFRWAAAVAGAAQKARGIDAFAQWQYADSLNLAATALSADSGGYRSEFVQLLRLAAQLEQPLRLGSVNPAE